MNISISGLRQHIRQTFLKHGMTADEQKIAKLLDFLGLKHLDSRNLTGDNESFGSAGSPIEFTEHGHMTEKEIVERAMSNAAMSGSVTGSTNINIQSAQSQTFDW